MVLIHTSCGQYINEQIDREWRERERERERDDIESRVAQGKRGGLITRRTVDRNHSLLTTINSFYAIREEQNSEQWGKNACTHTHTHTHTRKEKKTWNKHWKQIMNKQKKKKKEAWTTEKCDHSILCHNHCLIKIAITITTATTTKKEWNGRRRRRKERIRKKDYSTQSSQVVSNPSTNRARRGLTSLIGREVVLSSWYGRNQCYFLPFYFLLHSHKKK